MRLYIRPRHPGVFPLLIGATMLVGVVGIIQGIKHAHPAYAAPGDIVVLATQVDGTPDGTNPDGSDKWSATAGPGYDTGPNNGIVRTNDIILYNIEIRTMPAEAGVSFTAELPQGTYLESIPAFCQAGSTLTPTTMPAPGVPTTATSWTTLPTQVLTCNVGNRAANSTLVYPVLVKVRPEVPNGTVLTLSNVTAQSTTDPAPVALVTPLVDTVSAAPQYDLSKNSTALTPNTGYTYSISNHSCSFDPARVCRGIKVPILISAPAGGKGITPLSPTITFTDNLSPASLFPASYSTDPEWIAAGSGALAKYGAHLSGCAAEAVFYQQPGSKIGANAETTVTTSVRDSGTINCNQPGGSGTPVAITITNADTTAYTYPTQVPRPIGTSLPADKAYVFSGSITYDLPIDTIVDLGIKDPTHESWAFQTDNKLQDFAPLGIDGSTNREVDLTNNSRTIGYVAANTGTFSKAYSGVPGDPNNTSPVAYSPGNPIVEGLPGSDYRLSGNITAVPTQPVISGIYFNTLNPISTDPISVMTCDSWDNTKLWLKAGDYQASTMNAALEKYPSNGSAVWLAGVGPNQAAPPWSLQVEYGGGAAGGSGSASVCDDASSPVGWFSDPNSVPGNDPTKAATGVYTAVTRVRVYMQMPYIPSGWTSLINIGQVVADNPGANGTYIPNYAATKIDFTGSTFATLNTSAFPWRQSTYNPTTHTGMGFGDRLTLTRGVVRINKESKDSDVTSYSTSIVSTSGGRTVDYRLSPTFTSPVMASVTDTVTVEDCLPSAMSYVLGSASITPNIVQVSSPAGAGITCQPGETYLRWDLPNQQMNIAIPPITYRALVSEAAMPGTYTNTARVSSPADQVSTDSLRSASVQAQVVQPSGIKINKVALTPLVQVNRSDASITEPLQWRMDFSNINVTNSATDIDIIDLFPKNGLDGSSFRGSLTFNSVDITQGSTASQPITVLYSSDSTISNNPQDLTNAPATATTTWCTAPSGGTTVIGSGNCPSGNSSITAIRLLRPGSFNSGEVISAVVTFTAKGNNAGDLYVNSATGAMTGLLPVGPSLAPEQVVGSSIGDTIWRDQNKDSIQNTDEVGIANVIVTLRGTDDLGNTVTGTTTTDSNGHYTFTNLRMGTYRVIVDKTSLPKGSINTYSLGGGTVTPSNDSLVFDLNANEHRRDVDFGVTYPTPSSPLLPLSELLANTGFATTMYATIGAVSVVTGIGMIWRRFTR